MNLDKLIETRKFRIRMLTTLRVEQDILEKRIEALEIELAELNRALGLAHEENKMFRNARDKLMDR